MRLKSVLNLLFSQSSRCIDRFVLLLTFNRKFPSTKLEYELNIKYNKTLYVIYELNVNLQLEECLIWKHNIIWTKRYIVIFIDTDSKNISYYVL